MTTRFTAAATTTRLGGIPGPGELIELIDGLQRLLWKFSQGLPPHLRLSRQNLEMFITRPERSAFIMLHTWLYQVHVSLYSFALPDVQERATPDVLCELPPEYVDKCQKQAVAHAISLVQFWNIAQDLIRQSNTSKMLTADWIVGVCASHCCNVLHTARRHSLYPNLQEHLSAYMWTRKQVSDASLYSLVRSVVGLLESMRPYFPRIGPLVRRVGSRFHANSEP